MNENRKAEIFGLFDGSTSAIGVVGAAIISHNYAGLATLLVGLAVAAAASMGAGEWLQDPLSSFRNAFVMGGATLCGSLIPLIPFLFNISHLAQVIFTVGLMILTGIFVSWLRPGKWKASLIQTFTVLIIAASLAVLASGILSLL